MAQPQHQQSDQLCSCNCSNQAANFPGGGGISLCAGQRMQPAAKGIMLHTAPMQPSRLRDSMSALQSSARSALAVAAYLLHLGCQSHSAPC